MRGGADSSLAAALADLEMATMKAEKMKAYAESARQEFEALQERLAKEEKEREEVAAAAAAAEDDDESGRSDDGVGMKTTRQYNDGEIVQYQKTEGGSWEIAEIINFAEDGTYEVKTGTAEDDLFSHPLPRGCPPRCTYESVHPESLRKPITWQTLKV